MTAEVISSSPVKDLRRGSKKGKSQNSKRSIERIVQPVEINNPDQDVWDDLRRSFPKAKDSYGRSRKKSLAEKLLGKKKVDMDENADQGSSSDSDDSFYSAISREDYVQTPESRRIVGDEATGWGRSFKSLRTDEGSVNGRKKKRKRKKKRGKKSILGGLRRSLRKQQDILDGHTLPQIPQDTPLDPCWGDLGSIKSANGTDPIYSHMFIGSFGADFGLPASMKNINQLSTVVPNDSFSKLDSLDSDAPSKTPLSSSWEDLFLTSPGGTKKTVSLDHPESLLMKKLFSEDPVKSEEKKCDDTVEESVKPKVTTLIGPSFIDQFHQTVGRNDVLPTVEDEATEKDANEGDRKSPVSVISEAIDSNSLENKEDKEEPRVRAIRFADEQGLPIARFHHLGGSCDPLAVGRIVVLFLSPEKKKFEFAHAEYRLQAKATVANLLEQLPKQITSDLFSAKEYDALYRTEGDLGELKPSMFLKDCNLGKNEIPVAILKGKSSEEHVKCAIPLLSNPKVMKAVKHARRTGRGLKYVMDDEERQEEEELKIQEKLEKDKELLTSVDSPKSNLLSLETTKSSEIQLEKATATNQSAVNPPSNHIENGVQPQKIELPSEVGDKQGQDSEIKPSLPDNGNVVQLLHAGLVATIGVLYSMSLSQ